MLTTFVNQLNRAVSLGQRKYHLIFKVDILVHNIMFFSNTKRFMISKFRENK